MAYGLRHPWKFAFDKPGNRLVIGEVGQSKRDMILVVNLNGELPVNFWWPCYEGTRRNADYDECSNASPSPAFMEFENVGGAYVIGGDIYRKVGSKYNGFYVFMIVHYPNRTGTFMAVNLDTG